MCIICTKRNIKFNPQSFALKNLLHMKFLVPTAISLPKDVFQLRYANGNKSPVVLFSHLCSMIS